MTDGEYRDAEIELSILRATTLRSKIPGDIDDEMLSDLVTAWWDREALAYALGAHGVEVVWVGTIHASAYEVRMVTPRPIPNHWGDSSDVQVHAQALAAAIAQLRAMGPADPAEPHPD